MTDRCAECDAAIPLEHRLPGPRGFGWYAEPPPAGAVLTRCPGCLAVSAVWPESGYPGGPLPRRDEPELWMKSSEVSRAIEKLRDFEARGQLQEGVAQLRHSRKPPCLLRVPEVFAVARAAFGETVMPVRETAFRVTGREGKWFPRTADPLLRDAYRTWPNEPRTRRVREGDPSVEIPTYYPRPHKEGPTRDDAVPQGVADVDGDDPFGRIVHGATLRVLRGRGVFLEVVPFESEWVASGTLSHLRLALDLAIPVDG